MAHIEQNIQKINAMTTEEKAKAYDEALERARAMHDVNYTDSYTKANLETIFHELRESEDETTRKELLDFVRSFWADHKEKLPQTSRWVTYLEKQKEQKPDIELIQRSWYMEGYHDREFGKEPKWIIKTGEDGPKYEPNPKYGKNLSFRASDEQMKGLKFFLDFHRPQRNAGTTNWQEYDAVESLYKQLKNL